MGQALVQQTAMEFFKQQMDLAVARQRVEISALTEYYLVSLLAGSIRSQDPCSDEPGAADLPLAILYTQAMQAPRTERARLLRALGDTALFVSGFFADNLVRRRVDPSYYRAMGGRAYESLSRNDELLGFGPELYAELAVRFHQFADVLSEVAESTRPILESIPQLYERWLRTGSGATAQRLVDLGVVPIRPSRTTVQ